MKLLLAKKKQMEQIFNEGTGKMVPVTIVEAGPCFVSQVKTEEKDGYSAVQLVFGKKKKMVKPQTGHLKAIPANAFSREVRMSAEESGKFTFGDKVTAASFEEGDMIGATGISKGQGFQGVVKRHNFAGSPASHGHKDQLRMPGSIGATDPARVFKGTRMAGHMGAEQVTTKGLSIVKVDAEKNLLYISGAVPGSINGYLIIKGNGEMTIEKSEVAETKKEEKKVEKKETPKTEAKVEEKKPAEKEQAKEEVKA